MMIVLQTTRGHHPDVRVSGKDATSSICYRGRCGRGTEAVPGVHSRCRPLWKPCWYVSLCSHFSSIRAQSAFYYSP